MPEITGSDAEPRDPAAADTGDRLRAIGVGFGLTVAAILVSLLGGVAFAVPIVLLDFDISSTPVFLVLTAAGQLGFLIVAYAYARRRGLRIRIAILDRREVGFVVGGTIAALVIASALAYLLEVLGLVPGSAIEEITAENPNVLLGLAVLSVILIAPVEEFLFRGVVQGRLRESFGPVGAIVGASLLFGSVHLANYTGALNSVVAGALLIAGSGAVLGVLYELTRNLSVPIVTHALYNVILLVSSYLYV